MCVVVVLTGAWLATGCGKSESPHTTVPTAEIAPPVKEVSHEPVPSVPTVTVAPVTTPSGEPDLGELNRCLLRWVMGNRRKPASFEEFAASANVAIPPAPAGQKYAIDKTMHIVLVKQ